MPRLLRFLQQAARAVAPTAPFPPAGSCPLAGRCRAPQRFCALPGRPLDPSRAALTRGPQLYGLVANVACLYFAAAKRSSFYITFEGGFFTIIADRKLYAEHELKGGGVPSPEGLQ